VNYPEQDKPPAPAGTSVWPANFRALLNANAEAAGAHRRLVDAGVPDQELTVFLFKASRFLRWRSAINKTPLSFEEATSLKDARSVDRLVGRLRKLADELDALNQAIAIPVAFVTEPWTGPESDALGYWDILTRLPVSVGEVLRAEASFLESISPSVARQPSVSTPEIIEDAMVSFVKRRSGAPHYADVTIMLNWLYKLPGCRSLPTTEEALSRRAQRRKPDANS
jgi:hypothetical protein